jgi:putative nucleotidyltransferase with HDIG domain
VLTLAFGRLLASTSSLITLPSTIPTDLLALLAPVAGGAMLVRVLVNSESALVWAVVASVLCGVLLDTSPLMVSWYVVTAFVATLAVGPARERLAVLRAGLWCGLAGAAMVLLLGALRAQDPTVEEPFTVTLGVLAFVTALLAGLLSAVLALGIVPAFELFGFVTDYKLLELASLNHPLLRQLMLRAPGTYHHSVIVGTLSEAACETIGANALLARVACYFHDIGKGLKPQYFIENQRETGNRHDRLSPEASAAVIINHVREGGVLALQHKLPRPIVDNIYMHHGTGIIQYFYARAKEQAAPGEVVDERLFRYPGPKPDSREAGVIMLADKVEAACRTIKEPNEERIRAMIQQIINSVMTDGQFDRCPLTLRELYQIADTFTTVLLGIYHHRIEYPATREISSGKGRLIPVPKQGTITLEIMNPLRGPPPYGSAPAPSPSTQAADEEPTARRLDES